MNRLSRPGDIPRPSTMAALNQRTVVRIDAGAAADGLRLIAAPASILVELTPLPGPSGWHTCVLAAGSPSEVDAHLAAKSTSLIRISRPQSVLIPGLVNAHAHLDLTHMGPQPHDPAAGFVTWIDRIRTGRRVESDDIADSVEQGLRLSAAAGTVAIGDIAGAPLGRPSLVPWQTMKRLGGRGVSFLEFFAIGSTEDRALAAVRSTLDAAAAEELPLGFGPAVGIQPHAPNTVSRRVYREILTTAAEQGRLVSTHLAETPEEREFVAHARGPQRELLERLGVWTDSILNDVGHDRHPVDHLAELLQRHPMLVAHVNDVTDAGIEVLRRSRASVAYCPHASTYFGAPSHFGPHRYRDMLAAGVNVAIGTDSVVNLPPGPDRRAELSVLNEIRMLWQRDGGDPAQLLRMATTHGAAALGMPHEPFTFTDGHPLAGLLAIEVAEPAAGLKSVLSGSSQPEILFADNHSGLAGILVNPDEAAPTLPDPKSGHRGKPAGS